VCAALLPEVVAANVQALRQRAPADGALARYDELALLLTGSLEATIDDAIAWLRALVIRLEIPPLSHYGFSHADAPALVEKARVASSMKANPIVLTDVELTAIVDVAPRQLLRLLDDGSAFNARRRPFHDLSDGGGRERSQFGEGADARFLEPLIEDGANAGNAREVVFASRRLGRQWQRDGDIVRHPRYFRRDDLVQRNRCGFVLCGCISFNGRLWRNGR
jgi:hypothetical protein